MHENVSTKVAVTTSVTPVHGRPEFRKHRNSNHQRNLSLDFRYDVTHLTIFDVLSTLVYWYCLDFYNLILLEKYLLFKLIIPMLKPILTIC